LLFNADARSFAPLYRINTQDDLSWYGEFIAEVFDLKTNII